MSFHIFSITSFKEKHLEKLSVFMVIRIKAFPSNIHNNSSFLCVFTSRVGLQAAFDADWQAGRITVDSYRNGTEDGALAYKLLIQTGSKKEPFNHSQVPQDR